jgi:diaminohydroxyphosphoribosylaminopyrimidine deaminase/5-amino-6-(5-phosphoribosylamino)uracil reductase
LIADDPQLTVRDVSGPIAQGTGKTLPLTPPLRVVLDSHLRTPVTAKILQGGCLIATASTDPDKTRVLEAAGAEVVVVPDADGRVEIDALLKVLAARGVNEVHVEGGPRLSGVFLKSGLIDELLVYMAPCLLGSDARGWFDDLNLTALDQRTQWQFQDVRMVGPDLRIIARPEK